MAEEAKEHDWDVCYGLKPRGHLLNDHGLKAVAIIGLD